MRAVLISIKPKWCELIANGQKTVEVRKTKPKLETPFKVYIYCTKDEPMYRSGEKFWCKKTGDFGNGKVIGVFLCDRIDDMRDVDQELTCLTIDEWLKYTDGHKDIVYGWHITDLVIFDEPKELSEFSKDKGTEHCGWGECDLCRHGDYDQFTDEWFCRNIITRPPQSWCYVEEVTR